MTNQLTIKYTSPTNIYFTDLRHRVRQLPLRWEGGTCVVELPDDTPIAIHAKLFVPGFGYIWATADNEGTGYVGGNISLVHELASSRIARCERAAATFSLEPNFYEALSRLKEGDVVNALAASLVTGEEIELCHARTMLQTRDKSSYPGPIISATLFGERLGPWAIGVGPDWPLGQVPDFLRPLDQWDLVAQLCNGTIMPNFWRWIEYEQGRYRWEPLDKIVEFAERKGMAIKSFAIYWGGVGGVPPWFRGLDYEMKKRSVERWATDLISRYRGRVAAWEIVNEMHDWGFANPFHWSHEQMLEMTRFISEIAGSIDPHTPRVINHCCIWGEYVQEGVKGGPWCPLTYLEDLIEAGVEFEGIGLQYYYPERDLMECIQHLDRFIQFGKDIYITEMGTPSRHIDPNAGWRGPWTSERQADWVESWYILAASRPKVKLMNWWDFDDRQAFIAHAGLLDGQGRPKQAYHRLHALCQRYGLGRYQ